MTIEEAKQALLDGETITHRLFEKGTHMTLEGEQLRWQDGRYMWAYEFFKDENRKKDEWQDGYSIYVA
jgi:hypothetical protein